MTTRATRIMTRHWRAVAGAALALLASAGAATAESAADFFAGKQISMIVPSGVGGGYDLYGRFLARFIGRHIPGNPATVVKNMPAAGGIGAANHLYSIAAADGLTMGVFQNTVTLNQLGRMAGAKFDVRRYGWLGNMSIASTICALAGKAKNLQARDLFTTEVTVGASGGSTAMIPTLLNSLAGTRFNVVRGYLSTSNVTLAMEKGEVDGLCGWSWDGARVNAKDMLSRGVGSVALDIAIQPQPELKAANVPFLMDLLPEGENKDVLKIILSTQVYNRPIAVPPGVPEDRLRVLRDAFTATMRDPDVQAEADRLGLDLEYLDPEGILKLIDGALDAPARVQERAVDELKKAGFGAL
jgi:tripartite-type tricarboxylate transporter receptor subunit TctC